SLVLAEERSVIHRSWPDAPSKGTGWMGPRSPQEFPLASDRDPAAMRYRMLETVREYAAEQLSAEEQAKIACWHAGYYLSLAERAEPDRSRERRAERLARLERELDNMRAVLDWAVAHAEGNGDGASLRFGPDPAELGLRLAGALPLFWDR